MRAVKFDATMEEYDLAHRIGERAVEVLPHIAVDRQRTQYGPTDMPVVVAFEMDVIAVHANGCPLDLQKMLDADDFNFAHDLAGIYQHLDRDSGKLDGHFLPRCSAQVTGEEQ